MNLIEGTVTKILGEPFEAFTRWWVKVEYDAYGRLSETELMFSTKEKAESVTIGFKFDC